MAVQPPNRTIILVGMMGAGKSTIGKALAALMGTKFVDLDERWKSAAESRFLTFSRRKVKPASGAGKPVSCRNMLEQPIWLLRPAAESLSEKKTEKY